MTHLEALDASLDRARIAELIGQGRYADAETAIRRYVRQVGAWIGGATC